MRAGTVIIVPCFNEADRLDRGAFKAFDGTIRGIRLVLVDDGSTDGTAEILSEVAAGNPGSVSTMRLERNRGKAEAVRQGVLECVEASDRYLGYWDADLATPLEEIEAFQGVLDDDPGLIGALGSRWRRLGGLIDRRASRHYTGRIFATVASRILDMPVYDTQCGAKLFRVAEETLEAFAEPFVDRWVFDVELLARLKSHRVRVGGPPIEQSLVEIPLVRWQDEGTSKVKLVHSLGIALGLLKIRKRYGQYLR